MDNLPPLEDLKLLCAVVRNMSFVATARELGVSPAFVSKRIALLEEVLGVRLLHRTTRRVSMTEDGERVHVWAQRIIDDLAQMAESIRAAKTTPQGLIRINASAGFARKRLCPLLSELVDHYPALRIDLEQLDRPVDLIGEGVDLDIRIGGTSQPSLIVRQLAANSRILCAAPAYLKRRGTPRTLAQLTSHDCIIGRERDLSFGIWKLSGPKGVETVRVSGSLSSNNGEIVHQWALDGHGIMLRSTWDVEANLERGDLVRVLPEYEQDAPISAVYPLRLSESAKVRACVEFLQQRLNGRHALVSPYHR